MYVYNSLHITPDRRRRMSSCPILVIINIKSYISLTELDTVHVIQNKSQHSFCLPSFTKKKINLYERIMLSLRVHTIGCTCLTFFLFELCRNST